MKLNRAIETEINYLKTEKRILKERKETNPGAGIVALACEKECQKMLNKGISALNRIQKIIEKEIEKEINDE